MPGKDCPKRPTRRPLTTAARLAALLAVGAASAGLLQAAPAGRAAATARGTAAGAPASVPATSAAASAPAAKPPLQADAILSKFPGNANVLAARSDARNFTVEGRVRDVRTVSVDAPGPTPAGPSAAPAGAPPKTELRVALVGRAQADDLPAHFACRFDKATEEAAGKLQPDQIVRLTGAIGAAVAAADRIDLLNCHDLSVTGAPNLGDQLAGVWRANEIMVDGAALRKANQARGIKSDDVPDANYPAPWHLDLGFKSDGTMAVELADNSGSTLKRLTGRYLVLKDGTAEARLRLDVQGAASQETVATLDAGRLKLTLPGLADKFVLPDLRLGKLDGAVQTIDYKALKDLTMQWFGANVTLPNANNLPKFVSDAIDNSATAHQGFVFTIGAGILRHGKTALVFGVNGKLFPLEYSDAETIANAAARMNANNAFLPNWGTVMVPEIKIEALSIANRTAFDANKPLTGKISLRGLHRMPEAQYVLLAASPAGVSVMNIPKPGPDPQTLDLRFNSLPSTTGTPRPLLFFAGRQGKPNDLFGDNANRVISDPVPILLDIAPPK
jgi:hypothetical protein